MQPWEGERKCKYGCGAQEIEGLEFCLRHIPKADLSEAEEITGLRRCNRCSELATDRWRQQPGSEPLCPRHTSEQQSPAHRVNNPAGVENAMAAQLGEIMAEHGHRLLRPPETTDVLTALMRLEAEISVLRQILAEKIATLNMDEWRYAHNRVGEQIRTEVLLYERALDRHAKILVNIAKLHIREHKARMDAELVKFCIQKFTMALEASGADLDGQQRAREVLARELQKTT